MADYKITQIGQDIDGENLFDYSANEDTGEVGSLSISADGSIVAIGANGNDGANGEDSGHVRIYQNNSGTWQQIGDTINDLSDDDKTGERVTLSGDGTVLAVSSWNGGPVRLYERNGDSWTKTKEFTGSYGFGYSISLSEDGNVIAIGALYADSERGAVHVYKKNGNNWEITSWSLTGD